MDSDRMSPTSFIEHLQKRPGMFGLNGTFLMYVAFLRGYEHAEEASWFRGFRDWLAEKYGDGFNLGWESLVVRAAFPGDPGQWIIFKTRDSQSDSLLVGKLFELLSEYLDSYR